MRGPCLQLIALSLGGGANIILPTCGCVHLRIDVDEALAPIQRPKPHIPKDEPEPPACFRWGVPKPCPSWVDAYEHVASCCPAPASTSPTNDTAISTIDNASTATNTSTHQNRPNWHNASISKSPNICYDGEGIWNLPRWKKDLKLTTSGKPEICDSREGTWNLQWWKEYLKLTTRLEIHYNGEGI